MIQRLVASDQGVLGWYDLMLFRLNCSADRQGQLFNLYTALIVHQDESASTTGYVRNLALLGMRKLSQEIFALFKKAYVEPRRNFFSEVNKAKLEEFVGEFSPELDQNALIDDQSEQGAVSLSERISVARSTVKSFVIYQLSNSLPPDGDGVGCGYYDEIGNDDGRGIARLLNDYVFGVCFNPEIDLDNVLHFVDYCLSNLSSSFFSGGNENGYFATKTELSRGLDSREMGRYWSLHRELIRQRVLYVEERYVVTSNYKASYSEDLDGVFTILDELAGEAALEDAESDKPPTNPS